MWLKLCTLFFHFIMKKIFSSLQESVTLTIKCEPTFETVTVGSSSLLLNQLYLTQLQWGNYINMSQCIYAWHLHVFLVNCCYLPHGTSTSLNHIKQYNSTQLKMLLPVVQANTKPHCSQMPLCHWHRADPLQSWSLTWYNLSPVWVYLPTNEPLIF